MKATFRLLNSYFWKTFYGPILSFVLPSLLMIVLGGIFRVQYVFPGVIAMAIMFIGIIALPLLVMELKSSSLFKYIGASPVTPWKFIATIILYYMLISFLSVFVIWVTTAIFFPQEVFTGSEIVFALKPGEKAGFDYWIDSEAKNISKSVFSAFSQFGNIFSFILACMIHFIFVVTIGMGIATFSKTPQQALTIALSFCIPMMFLSGMVVSVDVISQSKVMQWLSRLTPMRYSVGNIVSAMTPLNQRDIYVTQGEAALLGEQASTVLRKMITDRYSVIGNSSPSLFSFNTHFSVRRIPEIEQIKEFVIEYFGAPGDLDRYGVILDRIQDGEYQWLDLFFNQNNVLYTGAEKALNIFLPTIGAIGLINYSNRKFKWLAR